MKKYKRNRYDADCAVGFRWLRIGEKLKKGDEYESTPNVWKETFDPTTISIWPKMYRRKI